MCDSSTKLTSRGKLLIYNAILEHRNLPCIKCSNNLESFSLDTILPITDTEYDMLQNLISSIREKLHGLIDNDKEDIFFNQLVRKNLTEVLVSATDTLNEISPICSFQKDLNRLIN